MSSYCILGSLLSTVHMLWNVMLKTTTQCGVYNSKCLERSSQGAAAGSPLSHLCTHHLLEALPDTVFKIATPFILLRGYPIGCATYCAFSLSVLFSAVSLSLRTRCLGYSRCL